MANTGTTTRSLHSGFKRPGADLVTTMTSHKGKYKAAGKVDVKNDIFGLI